MSIQDVDTELNSDDSMFESEGGYSNFDETQGKHRLRASENKPATSGSLQIGDMLKDRFILVDALGEGGMGMVFKALDKRKQEAEDTDPFVAIKVLRPEMSDDQTLFVGLQRETKRAQQLSHPNIIRVYDFDRDGSYVFMSMEYLTGKTLADVIKTASPISLVEAWPLIEAMGNALSCAHSNHIVHSDFKPSNVFIKTNGMVKILDFGIASKFNSNNQDEDADRTRYNPRGLGALTEAYASLEMLDGTEHPDPRDDIYAFGCVIYQLLTGKHPFTMLSAKQVHDFNKEPQNKLRQLLPTPIPGLPAKQMDALNKALSLERTKRTKTIAELLNALKTSTSPSKNWNLYWGVALSAALGVAFWYNQNLILNNKLPAQVTTAFSKVLPSKPTTEATQNLAIVSKPTISLVETKPILPVITEPVVNLTVLKPSYKIGEQLMVKFSLKKPMYVRMVHKGAKGKTSDLLPNPFQPMALLKPNQDYFVPPKGAKFSIDIEGPVGVDTVTIFASDKSIPNTSKLMDNNGFPSEQAKTQYSWEQVSYSVER